MNTHMNSDKFNNESLIKMFKEMAAWLEKNQVSAAGDPNRGAIYFPTEKRYCNRDTACMARAFMRLYSQTTERRWYQKAALARDHVLFVQKPGGGFPELRGLEESDEGSTVNTSIIAANLIKAYELGLEYKKQDIDALKNMADFVMSLEWKPGAFYHDTNHTKPFKNRWGEEGSRLDCQNTTALAAMILKRIYYFLESNNAAPKKDWLQASNRAIEHLLQGQDSDGQWPYHFGAGKDRKDAGHHCMCMLYLLEASTLDSYDSGNILNALQRGAEWLIDQMLLPTRWGTKINWARYRSACIYFTVEYFLIAAPLMHLAKYDISNRDQYLYQSMELLRYVSSDLWNNANYEAEGPYRLTEGGIKIGYAWFGQSMGWAIYALDEIIEKLGAWDDA